MRIGHGYDAHRFADESENKPLVLCGVTIPGCPGMRAHSDGDVVLHALIDSLFGAAGQRDIGSHFPDTSGEYKNIDSRILLAKTMEIIRSLGFEPEYCDMTIVAQKPKLAAYIDKMRESVASVMGVDVSLVNVKATTEEKMGFTGRCEGIAAHAVCLLRKE